MKLFHFDSENQINEDRNRTHFVVPFELLDRTEQSLFEISESHIKKNYAAYHKRGDLTILPIGRKAYDYFRKRDYKVESKFYELFSTLDFDHVRKAAEFVMQRYDQGDFDRVEIIYNEFKNVAQQILQVEQYLPIPEKEVGLP